MATPPLPAAFALLAHERNTAVDSALAEALADRNPEVRSAALDILLERGSVPHLAAVVGRFNESSEDLQSLILEHVGDLFAAVRHAIGAPVLEERAGAIEVVVRSETDELAYLLADALRSQCRDTSELAAAGLREMTKRGLERSCADHPVCETPGPANRTEYLAQALERGVMTWEIHLQPCVLEAAAWMADRVLPAIRKKLQEPQTKVAPALNDMLATTSDPRLARFALRALGIPALRVSAARAIGGAVNADFIHAVLSQGSLLADPEIRRGCRWIRDSHWLHHSVDLLLTLDGQKVETAVRLIDATGGPHERRIELYGQLLRAGDDDLHRAVVWQVVSDPSQAASDLLVMVAGRRTETTARIAARELQRRWSGTAAGNTAPTRSHQAKHDSPARLAFERLWERFGQATPQEGQRLLEATRRSGGNLPMFVRAKLASANPLERARALRMGSTLSILAELEEYVYALAYDPNPVVRSLAVSLLAELPGPTSHRILRVAVDDTDPRVQANAIEALDRLDSGERAAITKVKLTSANCRVRANAVKSLLRLELPEAGGVLLDMLEDPSRAHRLSGLWVAQRLHLSSVRSRIDEMSRHDRDERVRQRARRVSRDLGGTQDEFRKQRESSVGLGRRQTMGGLS